MGAAGVDRLRCRWSTARLIGGGWKRLAAWRVRQLAGSTSNILGVAQACLAAFLHLHFYIIHSTYIPQTSAHEHGAHPQDVVVVVFVFVFVSVLVSPSLASVTLRPPTASPT